MLDAILTALLGLLVGYLFGSFPTGYFAGRLYGVDVRRHGSGRTGGTNVLRTAGTAAFVLTVAGDIAKGMLPVLLMRLLFPTAPAPAAAAVVGALLGHNWSFMIALLARRGQAAAPPRTGYERIQQWFARAKGGAGVATTSGAALVLFWKPVVPLAVLGILLVIVFRYASLASITVAVLYPVFMAYLYSAGEAPLSYLVMSLIVAVIVLYVHIPNMKRLRSGTESRFGQRVGPTREKRRT